MGEVRFEENKKAIKELLGSEEVAKVIGPIVDDLCDKANETLTPGREVPGYVCAVESGRGGRKVGHVWAQGQYAKNSNAAYNTLLRLLYSMTGTTRPVKGAAPSRLLAAQRRAAGGDGMTWAQATREVRAEQ